MLELMTEQKTESKAFESNKVAYTLCLSKMNIVEIFLLAFCLLSIRAEEKQEQEAEIKDSAGNPYIVNGKDADPHEWPWQIMLLLSGRLQCGGSLISDRWVLTAAHCVENNLNPVYYTVIVGAHRRLGITPVQKKHTVKAIRYHPNYNTRTINNDVALLLLNEPVTISSKIKPIKLPVRGSRVATGKTCYVTGWGRLNGGGYLPDILQEARLTIGSYLSCRTDYGSNVNDVTMICAGRTYKAACNGDSGGPLSCYEGGEWILRGVVSWGRRGCLTSYYSVFARVSTYISWINSIISQKQGLNCDFEKSLCLSWSQVTVGDDFDWTRRSGSAGSNSGPSADHTKGTYYGYYMYIRTSFPRSPGDKARLLSDPIQTTDQACFSFWYHMYGVDINTLRVLVKKGGQSVTVWSRTGQSGNRWLLGQVNIPGNNAGSQIIIEGVVGTGTAGNIAIDDVTFTNGTCNISNSCRNQTCVNGGHAYCLNNIGYCYCPAGRYGKRCEFERRNCSFDNGLCSIWYQDSKDQFDWTLQAGNTPSLGTGPSFDHTTKSSKGRYMYIETTNRNYGQIARLISNTLPSTNQTCLSFWYHMYGVDINTLRVLVKNSNRNLTVWSRTGQSGNRWLQGQANIPGNNASSQIVIEGVVGNGTAGDIAIDDITFTSGTCNISNSCQNQTCLNGGHAYCFNNKGYCYCPADRYGKQCEFESRSCNFEDGICSHLWHQDRKDQFDWTRYKGSSPSYQTGPSWDHTTKNSSGWYIYIETSSTSFGDIARLISKTLPATNQTCLSFWIHMYGKDVNTLRVLVTSGSQKRTVWSRTGQIDNKWLQAMVNIKSQRPYQIIFEGVAGNSYQGDIALDDISIVNGTCNFSKRLNCSFDDGLCSIWYQDSKDQFDWTLQAGNTPSLGTGPSFDHTTKSSKGRYMYIETTYRNYGQIARLISNTLPATNQTCLSFWYHMYGVDINTLRVLVKNSNRNLTVWSRTGQSGNRWLQGQANIPRNNASSQIVIEGVVGTGTAGDIAIDDITITNGTCNISDSCRNQTCLNGGHAYCLNNKGYCYCPAGRYGKQCEFVTPSLSSTTTKWPTTKTDSCIFGKCTNQGASLKSTPLQLFLAFLSCSYSVMIGINY